MYTLAVFLAYVVILWILYRRGILKDIWQGLMRFVYFLTYNQPRRQATIVVEPRKDCRILHETASAEIEIYGAIMSRSIFQHMEECSIEPKLIKHDPPTRVDNCLHEYDHVEQKVGGGGWIGCGMCGYHRVLTRYEMFQFLQHGRVPASPYDRGKLESS